MAPPRKRTTQLGELLRTARQALSLGQDELARRVFVSRRQVSRWENGEYPTDDARARLFNALSAAPDRVAGALADALDLDIEAAAVPPPPPLPPPPPPPPPPTPAELRASLDAIILAAAEQRDVLPRHLRAFAVEMFQGADRLGLSAREAAALVATAERTDGAKGTEAR